MRTGKPILLVEDDNVDAMGVERAFKDLSVTNPLVRASNGEEALAYLNGKANARPCIILLDVNMPRMTGVELLRILKAG
jgi:CheY-like chemotaxis protein